MTPFVVIFLAGLAGSVHCLAMCGGFACAIGGDARGTAAGLRRQLLFNLGRLGSYVFIGAVVGQAGMLLVGQGSAGGQAQRALALLSGVLMLFIGLQFFGLFRHARLHAIGAGGAWIAQALRALARAPGAAAPLAFGVFNGFLPCPLVYAFAAQATVSGGALPGLQVMAAFGLGTFPAMLAMGGMGLWWRRGVVPGRSGLAVIALPGAMPAARRDWRVHGLRVAGGFILLLGLITLARGLLPMDAHAAHFLALAGVCATP